MRPSLMSRPATNFAVLMAIAKQSPCAGRIIAVLTPMTSPRESTSGPPEFPGFSAASVWMTLSIRRPERARSDRPRALTTPAVTLAWKPYGLPTAIAIWPTRSACESPSCAAPTLAAGRRRTARSVSGSSPTSSAAKRAPPAAVTSIRLARATTWLLVRTKPSGVKMKPDPLPPGSLSDRREERTSMLTTAGPTLRTASTTVRE